MIELSIKNFIQTHPNWEELLSQSPYNLTIRKDEGLVLFKYNQFESDMNERICQEARGIIFDEETLEPVCIPFFKFFNYGESNAAEINWNTAIVQEKVDGSLIKMFFSGNQWHIATNGTIDAAKAPVGDGSTEDAENFADLFIDALGGGDNLIALFDYLDPNFTYMFELVHPQSQVVINYGKKAVYFIGMRDNKTYEEYNPKYEAMPEFISRPKIYHATNLNETLALMKILNNGDYEGVVVCDKKFNRIKIKTEEYLVKARIANRGPLTTKRFAAMYLNETLDDYLAFAPEKKKEADEYLRLIDSWAADMEACMKVVNRTCVDCSRKEIVSYIHGAEHMRKVPAFFDFYMQYLDMKVSNPLEYISKISISQLVKCLTN